MKERMKKIASILAALAAVVCPVTCVGAEEKAITIAIAADPHFIAPTLTDKGEAFTRVIENADGKVMRYSAELMDAFVEQMLSEKPDVLLFPGDLTFNGATESHQTLAAVLRPLVEAGVRVLVLPGNHDIAYSQAARFESNHISFVPSPSEEEFKTIWQDYGFAQADYRDSASCSYTLSIGMGWRLLLLDANTQEEPGRIKPETIDWLRGVLSRARAAGERVITCSHQTLLEHNPLFNHGFRIANGDLLLQELEQGGSVLHLSGHMHIQHIAKSEKGLTEIVNSSLAVSPCQFGMLRLTENEITYETVKTNVSGWAQNKHLTNEDLLHFELYALKFFASCALRQTSPELINSRDWKQAIVWMINTNISYFSGRMKDIQRNEDALALLSQEAPFWFAYLKSIEKDFGKDFSKFTLQIPPFKSQ